MANDKGEKYIKWVHKTVRRRGLDSAFHLAVGEGFMQRGNMAKSYVMNAVVFTQLGYDIGDKARETAAIYQKELDQSTE